MLRRQKSCSVCGFACLSTWRSVVPSKPFICEGCRSKDQRPNNAVDTADTSSEQVNDGHEGNNNKTHKKTTEENPCINLKPGINVRKKKRSKLPQYTLSPVGRFINQLQQIAQEPEFKALHDEDDDDGVLLYKRCNNFIPSNEIGLGAELISSKSISSSSSSCSRKDGEAYKPKKKCHRYRRSESASTNKNEDEGSCLFDVPIKSP